MKRGEPLRRTEMDRRPTERLRLSEQHLAEIREGVMMRDWGRCIAEIVGVCTGRAQAVHHRLPRGQGGSSRNPKVHAWEALLSLCDACHLWIENHREQGGVSERNGWIVRHGIIDLETVATRWHNSWVTLSAEGFPMKMDNPPIGELL